MTRSHASVLAALGAFALAVSSAPAGAVAGPAPTPSPRPTPTPPPHAPSCADATTGSGTLKGTFPIPSAANVTATVSIQLYPDSLDSRAYVAQTETLLRYEEKSSRAPAGTIPSPVPTASGGTVPDPTAVSALLQRLQPVTRGTTTDASGAWACFGIPPATYRALATLSITTVSSVPATPIALPSSVPANVASAIAAFAGKRTTLSRYYYTTTLSAAAEPSGKTWSIDVPFAGWTTIAKIVQTTR